MGLLNCDLRPENFDLSNASYAFSMKYINKAPALPELVSDGKLEFICFSLPT